MVGVATHANDQQTRTAAAYFAALKPKPWIRVVETATVPKTHVAGWMLVVSEPPANEHIGHRIIETPENLDRTELRDDTSGFIAYVPPGSLKKGNSLVISGRRWQDRALCLMSRRGSERQQRPVHRRPLA